MTRGAGRRPAEALARTAAMRAKVLFYLFVACACFIVARFFVVQVLDGPMLAHRAYEQHLTSVRYAAHRGSILDRNGDPLATSLPSQSIYVSPGDVVDPGATAHRLAAVLTDVPETRIAATLRLHAGYVQLDHKVTHEQSVAIGALALPGISVVPDDTGVRFVPSGRLASTVLGVTGFDENGLEGLEYQYDWLLRGNPGEMVLEGDEFHRALPFAQRRVIVAAKAGHSLELTLDSYLQYETESVLRSTVAQWHAASGSAIVMDPNSGEILALANVPDFDVRDYGRFPLEDRRDRAVTDAYEPGSTFKLITAAAALDSGKVTPEDRFPARDRLEIAGSTIHNAEDGFLAGSSSTENLEEIIAKSHNVGAAEVGLRIGRATLFGMLKQFGFGETSGVGLPGESPGIVTPLADWSATSLPTISFGHGIATTPLAMARAYCAIANGGLLLRPRILAALLDGDGRVVYRYGPEIDRRVISKRTAAILRGYLRAVVLRGTGNPTAQVEGYATAGKTGTAQVAENGFYAPGKYVASFIGYIPAGAPRYVILVKVVEPHGAIYGSVVAAPAFARIAKIAMMHAGIPPASRLVRISESSKHRS